MEKRLKNSCWTAGVVTSSSLANIQTVFKTVFLVSICVDNMSTFLLQDYLDILWISLCTYSVTCSVAAAVRVVCRLRGAGP